MFPTILLALIATLSLLEVNGSSVGRYNELFYGQSYRDPDLLYGQPQDIRSDEWLVATPMIVAQANNDFQPNNRNIGIGQDMDVILDVPQADWSLAFEPQNWAFFVLPLENAFALKWWLIGGLLVLGCYAFTLTLVPKKVLFAALLSLSALFAPYLQWWYQTVTLAPIYYSLFILAVAIRLLAAKTRRHRLLWASSMAYLLVAFALVQYPPFQLPCGLAVAVFLVGYVLERRSSAADSVRPAVLYAGGAGAAAAIIVAAFVVARLDVVRAIRSTAYPGRRAVDPSFDSAHVMAGFLSNQLQDMTKAVHYLGNQSESSNFLLISPFLIIPSCYLAYRQFAAGSTRPYTLLFVNALLVAFIVRTLNTVNGDSFLPSILKIVPGTRFLLAVGFVSLLQLVLLVKEQDRVAYPLLVSAIAGLGAFVVLTLVGLHVRARYPGFVGSGAKIIGLAGVMAVIFWLCISRRATAAAALLLLISLYSSYKIHPLYRGLAPLTDSALARKIREVAGPSDERWVTLDAMQYNTYLVAAGVRSYSGVYTYPQPRVWQRLDPDGRYRDVYNRYAHVVFSTSSAAGFSLVSPDRFDVRFDGCSDFVRSEIGYVLAPHAVESRCLSLVDTVEYPSVKFFVYRVGEARG